MATKKKRSKADTMDVLESVLGGGVVATNVTLTKVLGSPVASIILSQFLFYKRTAKYIVKKQMLDNNGVQRIFFTKTAKEIYEDTGITEDMFIGARKVLRSCGVLVEVLSKGLYYAIDLENLINIINDYEKKGAKVVKKEGCKKRVLPPTKGGKFSDDVPYFTEGENTENLDLTFRNLRDERSVIYGMNVPYFTERSSVVYSKETKKRVSETEKNVEFSLTHSLEKVENFLLENGQTDTGVSLPLNEKEEDEKPPSCAAPPTVDELEPQERPIPAKWLALIEKAAYRNPKTYIGNSQRVNEIELASEMVAAAMLAGADDLLCDNLKQKNGMKPTDTLFHHFDDFVVNALTMGNTYQNQKEFRQHLRNFIPQNIKRLAANKENDTTAKPQTIKTLTTADLKKHLV